MPEMPEVQGLVDFLGERAAGRTVRRAQVAAISALKTYDPPLDALVDREISDVTRRGKFAVIAAGAELHLVFDLAKAGWLRWYEKLPATVIKRGRSPIALRVALDARLPAARDSSSFACAVGVAADDVSHSTSDAPPDVALGTGGAVSGSASSRLS